MNTIYIKNQPVIQHDLNHVLKKENKEMNMAKLPDFDTIGERLNYVVTTAKVVKSDIGRKADPKNDNPYQIVKDVIDNKSKRLDVILAASEITRYPASWILFGNADPDIQNERKWLKVVLITIKEALKHGPSLDEDEIQAWTEYSYFVNKNTPFPDNESEENIKLIIRNDFKNVSAHL